MPKKLTTEEFIKRARKIHGDKYDYSKVEYINNLTKVCIICSVHGEFWQRPYDHYKHGCGRCESEALGLKQRKTTEQFIEDARAVHGDRYKYSEVKYVNNSTKVCIICSEHRLFWQRPNDHLRGKGCPACSSRYMSQEEFIRKAKEKFGEKFDYSKVKYLNSRTKVCIHCIKHDIDFWQTPHAHLSGNGGCPMCRYNFSEDVVKKINRTKRMNNTFNISSLQSNLGVLLVSKFGKDDVLSEYSEDERYPFSVDFYIKSLDLFIELNGHWTHGDHWFDKDDEDDMNRLLYMKEKAVVSAFYKKAIEVWVDRDVKKRDIAKRNNLNYVVFWNGKQDSKGLTREINQWFEEGCPVRKDWK